MTLVKKSKLKILTGVLLVGGSNHPSSVQLFSFASKQWTSLKNLPTERMFHGSITMENGIYIVGGKNNKNIDKYNPSTGVFEKVALMAEYRYLFEICSVDSKSFIFTGGIDGKDHSVATSYIFNTNSKTLKKVGNLNTERYGFALVKSEDGDIYAIGGGDGQNNCLNTIEQFDKKTQSWKNVNTKLKIARRKFEAVAYKNYIYIISGMIQNCTKTNSIEKFDTITGEIKVIKTKLNLGRRSFAVAKLKNLVYIFGGLTDLSIENTVEVFNLDLEEIKEGKDFRNADFGSTANIF